MFGLLSTLQVGAGSQLVPVSCPIAFVPLDQFAKPGFGLIRSGDAQSSIYRAILDTALAEDYCRVRS